MTEQSPADRGKLERATKLLIAAKVQLTAQHEGVAWMVPNSELRMYMIGLTSGELRWLPMDIVDSEQQPPQVPHVE